MSGHLMWNVTRVGSAALTAAVPGDPQGTMKYLKKSKLKTDYRNFFELIM